MKGVEMLYAMECYGDMFTRRGKINAALQELKRTGDFSPEAVDDALAEQGIYDIDVAEYNYIRKQIEWLSLNLQIKKNYDIIYLKNE